MLTRFRTERERTKRNEGTQERRHETTQEERNAINCRGNARARAPNPRARRSSERSRLPCGFQKFHTLPVSSQPRPARYRRRATSRCDPSFRQFTASPAKITSDNVLGSFVPRVCDFPLKPLSPFRPRSPKQPRDGNAIRSKVPSALFTRM